MNNKEWQNPRRAVLIAHPRSGSTMLATMLDSHNDIGFERSEPFSSAYIWMQYPDANWRQITRLMLNRPGYRVVGFRTTYKTIPAGFYEMLRGNNVKVIHLTRENVLRTLISAEINTAVNVGGLDYPNHRFSMPSEPPPALTVDPLKMLKQARKLELWKADIVSEIIRHSLDCFSLTYEDIVSGNGGIMQMPTSLNKELCNFLDVKMARLVTTTRRVNPFLIHDLIKNHEELLSVFMDSEFGKYAEAEYGGHL